MATKTTKKTAKKTTTKTATAKKAARKPATKKPSMSKSAARAKGAQRTKAAKAKPSSAANPSSAKAKATTATKVAPKDRKPKRVSGLDLAAKVLADAKEPLNAKTIAERAIAAGWKTSGKTPEATLYAAIIREIAKKGKDARFVKRDRGLFAWSGKGV